MIGGVSSHSVENSAMKTLIRPGAMRLLLSVVVVVHHTSRITFGTLAVFLFFILSGYWIAKMWEEKYKKLQNSYGVFLISRYWRVAPVLILCVLLAIGTRLAIGEIDEVRGFFNIEWTIRSVLVIFSSSQKMLLSPKWSIDIEMQFYVIFPFLMFVLFNRNRHYLIGIVTTIIAILMFLGMQGYYNYPSNTIIPYLALFLIGIQIFTLKLRVPRKWAIFSLVLFLVICVAILAHPVYRYVIIGGPDIVGDIHRYNEMFSFLMAILLVPVVANSVQNIDSRFDYQLGNLAYPLYLFHFIPVGVLKFYVGHLPPMERLPYVAITYIVIIFGSLIIFDFDRRIDKYRRKFIGRQSFIQQR